MTDPPVDIAGIPEEVVLTACFAVASSDPDDLAGRRASDLRFSEARQLLADRREFDRVCGRTLGLAFLAGHVLDARHFDAANAHTAPLAARIVTELRRESEGAQRVGAVLTEVSACSAARRALMDLLPGRAWHLAVLNDWDPPQAAVLDVQRALHYSDHRFHHIQARLLDLGYVYRAMIGAWVVADDRFRRSGAAPHVEFEIAIDDLRSIGIGPAEPEIVNRMLDRVIAFTRGYLRGLRDGALIESWDALPAVLEGDLPKAFAAIVVDEVRTTGRLRS